VGTGFEDSVLVQGSPALQTSLHHSYSIAYDGGGNLYLAGFHVPWVLRVSPDMRVWTHAGTEIPGYSGDGGSALEAQLGIPTGVAAAAAGAPLYISDSEDHCIRVVDADGIIHTLAGNGTPGYAGDNGPAASCLLKSPYRVRLDEATGNVYVCDTGNHAVRRIDPGGTILTIAGTGVAGFNGDGGPAAVAQLSTPLDARVGPDGLLYIADSNNHRVRRVDTDGTIHTVAGSGTAGYSGDGGSALEARLNGPIALAFDAAGNLFVADTHNSVVRKIVLVAP
jgi:DNA-binding beta-propeller fold protein YncE